MKVVHTLNELRASVAEARKAGNAIGFVPTMGNLHAGHISLINRAKSDCDFVVSSIFVNPMQFNDPSDLERYPRTLPEDCEKLEAAHCDLVFAPNVTEMYPSGQDGMTRVQVPGVSEGLCGGSRPGHFDGVATVVTKLFNMVLPDVAFFGEKDFQQVAVIRKMVEDLNQPLQICTVPTARAEDGLALSSRNGYLTASERQMAPGLYKTLCELRDAICPDQSVEPLLTRFSDQINQLGFQTDYLELRDSTNLQPVLTPKTGMQLVILSAAWLGQARLIDNVTFRLK